MTEKVIHYLQWAPFFCFVGAALGVFIAWVVTGSLATAGIIATASAFLERLFPRGG